MVVKKSKNAVPQFMTLMCGQLLALGNNKCVIGASLTPLFTESGSLRKNPIVMTALSGIPAGTCTMSQEEDNRSYTNPGSMSLTQLRAHSSFQMGCLEKTWKRHRIFGVLQVLGVSALPSCHFHITPSLIYLRVSVAEAGGVLSPLFVFIRTAVRQCSVS